MKYLGSFIFLPAVIQRVLTTRLLLGTGLSKYPRLSRVPIAVWTYTCGYLSSGAPAPGTVWEVCACVSGVIPVSVPGCRRVPVTQCVTRTVCSRERRGGGSQGARTTFLPASALLHVLPEDTRGRCGLVVSLAPGSRARLAVQPIARSTGVGGWGSRPALRPPHFSARALGVVGGGGLK